MVETAPLVFSLDKKKRASEERGLPSDFRTLIPMQVDPDVLAYEKRRKDANVPADAILRRSGVSPSTTWNWLNNGAEPKKSTLKKLNDALDAEIAERAKPSA
jgi:hypothetical protein